MLLVRINQLGENVHFLFFEQQRPFSAYVSMRFVQYMSYPQLKQYQLSSYISHITKSGLASPFEQTSLCLPWPLLFRRHSYQCITRLA